MKTIKKLAEIYLIVYLVFMTGSYTHRFRSDIFIASYLIVGMLIAAWIIYSTLTRKEVIYPSHYDVYIQFFVVGVVISLLSVNTYLSFKELYFWFFYLFLFLGIINLVGYGWKWESLINSIMIVGGLFNLYKLIETSIQYIAGIDICSRGVDSPNRTAAYINIVLILALVVFFDRQTKKGRIFPILLIISSAIVLVATESRAGIMAASAGVFTVLVVNVIFRGWRKLGNRFVFSSVSAALITLPVISVFFTRPPQVCTSAWTSSITRRVDYWKYAMEIIKKYPILGSGPNTFGYLAVSMFNFSSEPAHPHNVYLRIMAERGIVGVIAAIALLLVLVKTFLVDVDNLGMKAAGLGVLASFLVHGIADVAWKEPFVGRYLAIVLALAISAPRGDGFDLAN